MTMLPIRPEQTRALAVLVALPSAAHDLSVLENLAAVPVDSDRGLFNISGTGVLALSHEAISNEVIDMADGFIAVLDGDLGLAPHVIDLWRHASDMSIPRLVAVIGSLVARADFDEMVAIVRRVLEPDVLVRYLPIESDEDESVVGLYDILTAEIRDMTSGIVDVRPADPEHIAITSERRDELFTELAYFAFDDYVFEQHEQGLPISVTSLERAWQSPDVITMLPIDNAVSSDLIHEWCSGLDERWTPSVSNDDERDVTADAGFGVGMSDDIARVWNCTTETPLMSSRGTLMTVAHTCGGLATVLGVRTNDTLTQSGRFLVVRIPRF